LILFSLLLATGCQPSQHGHKDQNKTESVKKSLHGQLPNEEDVSLYTLSNDAGMEIDISEYGGIITAIRVPDQNGLIRDVVLGFDSLTGYLSDHPYFGAIIGRYGNRIAQGAFSIDGTVYTLASNNGEHHLHGGLRGFDKSKWSAVSRIEEEGQSIELSLRSVHGDEGYPGNLDVTVTYTLSRDNCLVINYSATTDQKTHINLTNHSYFNLDGDNDILGHLLTLDADAYTPVDQGLIPLGSVEQVHGTPFDFRESKQIGADIQSTDLQMKRGGGYDHNYILNNPSLDLPFAQVYSPISGILMKVYTTEPGVQLYTGNFLANDLVGKEGRRYGKNAGFCLETQHYPDSPNQPTFPSTILLPNEKYQSTTIYEFGIQ